jgi:predicted RNA-binding Zn ribbon-like protein
MRWLVSVTDYNKTPVSTSAPTEIPSGLESVIDFINTLDVQEQVDSLTSPNELSSWLRSQELLADDGAEAQKRDLGPAIELREALRALARANNGNHQCPDAWATLERAARVGKLSVHFDHGGDVDVRPEAGGITGALTLLLARVAAAVADGTWVRVKACRSDTCEWAFYDRSRNHSAVWCEMAVCGNRTKVRAYRERAR